MHSTLGSKRANQLTDSPPKSSSPASNITINDLPCEMLLKVFSYLDQDTLLNTIPKVCRRWETLHSDPSLYRRFTFTDNKPSTDEVLKMLSMAKWLKILVLYNRNDTNEILECVITSNQRLMTLILQNCQGSPSYKAVSAVSVRGVLKNCNLLQHLSLKGSHCLGKKVYNEIGLRLPSLKSVDLGKTTRYDSQALVNIAGNCRNLEDIRAFDIDNFWANIVSITDLNISSLCVNLRYLSSVHINIKNCTDACMFSLATCQQLKAVDLRCARNITDIGIMAISDMPQLVQLKVVWNNNISSQGWLAFLQRPIMRRLQKLELVCCYNVNHEQKHMILNNPYDLRELFLQGIQVYCMRSFNHGNH